jgi:hypothetical protein
MAHVGVHIIFRRVYMTRVFYVIIAERHLRSLQRFIRNTVMGRYVMSFISCTKYVSTPVRRLRGKGEHHILLFWTIKNICLTEKPKIPRFPTIEEFISYSKKRTGFHVDQSDFESRSRWLCIRTWWWIFNWKPDVFYKFTVEPHWSGLDGTGLHPDCWKSRLNGMTFIFRLLINIFHNV